MEKLLGDLSQATDEELMVAYQKGQEEAFQLLYQRHHRRVYGFLYHKLGRTQLIEDTYQMIFMKLHQARHQYDPSFPFTAWLFTVCRSVVADTWRSQKRVEKQEELNPDAIDQASSEPTVHEKIDIPDLHALPTEHRQAVELRYLNELSFDEIAKRLETSPANARQIVSRAVRTLKRLLQGSEGENR